MICVSKHLVRFKRSAKLDLKDIRVARKRIIEASDRCIK